MTHNKQQSKGAVSAVSASTLQSLLAAPAGGEGEREIHADQG